MTVRGIDAASYQPDTLTMSGLSFAFVKATEGTTYTNPRQAAQVTSVRKSGAVLGHYHFLHSGNIDAQVKFFLEHSPYQVGDMFACDWETPAKGTGQPATDAEKGAFLAAVKKARPAARVLLYCNTDFWLHRDLHSVCGDGLWIADPNSPAGHPKIRHAWTFHQYGMAKGTDLNVGNFADLNALRRWAGVPAPKGTPPPAPTVEQRLSAVEGWVTKLRQKVGI